MGLRECRDLRGRPELRGGLHDLLNYAVAEDDHTIVMKDGARLAAFECLGPDLNSASVEELDAHRALANRALIRLDENFAYQADFTRYPGADYPKRAFPDPVSSMIGHEGALHYAQEGRHYESRTVFSLACRKISEAQSKLAGVFASGAGGRDRDREREWFKQQLQEFADAMSPVWKLMPLDLSALLSHITSCINGRICQVKAPRGPVPLDAVLGNQEFITGSEPRIGGGDIHVLSPHGPPPRRHAELPAVLAQP